MKILKKRFKILIVLIFILLLIMGITFLSSCQINTKSSNDRVINNIEYFKDDKTGICFATINSFNSSGSITSITNVPCENVKYFLK